MHDPFQISKSPPSIEKQPEDQPTNKAPHSSVTLIYEANVAEFNRNVIVTWNKSLINYSLTISVENLSNENHYTCKIDLKTWQFWGRKGLKSFPVDGGKVDVYWDFRRAKFSSNPEPSSDYYVALVYEEEVVLMLGDSKKDAYRRTKKRPSMFEPILLCKKENVYGKKIFCTKAMLHLGNEEHREHDIVIEMSSGLGDPELWISIDSFEVTHVKNLHWRFRGNEKVIMNNVVIDIFWDVHDWLFGSPASQTSGHGLFIFKPGELDYQPDSDTNRNRNTSRNGNNVLFEDKLGLGYDSSSEIWTPSSGFFHVVYAWKLE
ncbi:conserved hypothetical protein [Ricinus communis]|uniref:Uncharacterized protein n=1 Tax=Ricinus communis TaxID=3988 RepID=B9T1Q0_RICCO|nr:conserved hypothetical protein [Ricinus communis]|eukprot:XP_002532169.1 uncharacterized protein LOC8271841 [Ricinus communis]